MTEHISRQFDTEIEALRTGVLSMGGLVEKQFQRALIALGESDEDILDAVARDEQAINQAQMTIDHQCLQVIARRLRLASYAKYLAAGSAIASDDPRLTYAPPRGEPRAVPTRGARL